MASVLDYLVKSCAEKLQEIITEDVALVLGVKEDLKQLQRTMTQIQCFLLDAEQRRTKESSVNSWLGELREAMYYTDDIIDLARSEAGKLLTDYPSSSTNSTRCGGFLLFTCIPTVQKRHKIRVKIREFYAELEKISVLGERYLRLQNRQPKPEDPTVKHMRTSHLVEPNLVGKETVHACERLVQRVLAHKEKQMYKVGIVGIGGIGKTTLAQKIYNDQKLQGAFSKKAWICVSQEYSEAALLKELLRNFAVHHEQDENVEELSRKLAAAVADETFFLVLDDVWQPGVWTNLLRIPLHAAATGVILVTTRHDNVAHAIGVEDVHRVYPMSADVGWELLWKSMNLNEEKDVGNLRNIGLDIVRNKCYGLPLAIKVIASVLATKEKTENEWRKFIDRSAWSMGNLPTELRGALYLSYDDLPSRLKECFLYCALYPEDAVIHRNDLVIAWVAEGFVERQPGQLLEDIAEEYYYELIQRNLLQPDGAYSDLRACKMPPLLRQLACYISREECFIGDPESLGDIDISKLRRYTAVTTKNIKVIPSMDKWEFKVRTFMTDRKPWSVEETFFKRIPYVRVLVLSDSFVKSIPDYVGNLIHLRLLDLDGTDISNLPESIGSLRNLQMLNLSRCKALHSLPLAITQLSNLRRLGMKHTPINQVPNGVGRLEFLNDLDGFPIGGGGGNGKTQDGWKLEELKHLLQLRRLDMDKLERSTPCNTDSLLTDKKHLKVLTLRCTEHTDRGYSEEAIVNIEKVFEQLIPPHNLEDLAIIGFFGRRCPTWLASVAKIGLEFVGCRGANPRSRDVVVAFPKLETLIFRNMPNLEEWSFDEEEDASSTTTTKGEEDRSAEIQKEEAPSPRLQLLPRLMELVLVGCPKLRALPRQLGQEATSLKHLVLEGASCLKVVEDLPFLSRMSLMGCEGLERVSNLPQVQFLAITGCPNLTRVEELGCLQLLVLSEGMRKISSLWQCREPDSKHPDIIYYTAEIHPNCKSPSSNDPPGHSAMHVPTRVSVTLGIVGPSRTSDVSTHVDDVSIQGRGHVRETGAPVSALLGAMRPLLGKLDMLLLAPPQGYSKKVKDEMCLLKDDVEEINSYLDELSEVEDPPPMAKSWMNEARDLSYDMEDYIDSLYVPLQGNSLVAIDTKTSRSHHKLTGHIKTPKRLKWQQQIEATISEFRMYVQEAIQRREVYVLSDSNIKSTLRLRFVSIGPMLPTPYEETADIVIDGRMNEFINSLANDADPQLKVLSVLGSACLGKTTLAKVLYSKFAGQYDCRAFIRVSKKPDMKRIFRDMLSQVQLKHPPQDCKEIDLIDGIRKCLQAKRYLIIIDDVWAASIWDIISHAFPKGSHGSRIITTTQIEDVALTCCCYQPELVFEMKPLDDEHSRKLFFKRLSGSESYCPQQFREVLNEIVELCGGLPLATISIASLLASQPVIPIDLLTYIHHSLSSYILSHSTSDITRQVLNLCFNNLPHYLKTCLMYLGMYSEGHTFCKDDMVKQWVTEGFIGTTEGQDMEKVAGGYLDQLIGRRFIQPICINYNNEVVSCAVHDAVHELIALKSSEENFIVAIDYSRKNVSLSHKVRRLSLLFGDARYAQAPTNIRKSQVRSLRFFGLFECMPCIAEFKLLRVLNLQLSGHSGSEDDPVDLTGISELLQLRYLKIACDVCIELPNHGLQLLETLDIMDARLAFAPWDIHLPHLLHLTLPVERNLLDWPISLGSLGKLNYLHDLHLTSSSSSSYTPPSSEHLDRRMEALGSLLGGHGNLKTIVVADGSSIKNIVVVGASKVTIYWDGMLPPPLLQRFELSPRSGIIFSQIPMWVGELGNLCTLKIAVRVLQTCCVDILRGLPALAALSLNVETAPIDKIIFDKVGFSVLKYFKLRFMSGIASLEFEADAMPNLWKLKLVLNDIPQMVQQQHGTTVISIKHMPGLKEISAKFGGVAANADAVSALRAVFSNHASNPTINMQLVDYSFYGDKSTEQKPQPDEILEEESEIRETSW
ncbi:unnamed protein product [Alopecurus aequalis]